MAPGAAEAPLSAVAAAEAPAAPAPVPADQIVISNPVVDRLANLASSLIVGRRLQSGAQDLSPRIAL